MAPASSPHRRGDAPFVWSTENARHVNRQGLGGGPDWPGRAMTSVGGPASTGR